MHALVFDLDGTLVDTVFAHVLAWQVALDEAGVAVDGHRLHTAPRGFAIYQAAPGLNRLGPRPPPDLKPWQPRAGHG